MGTPILRHTSDENSFLMEQYNFDFSEKGIKYKMRYIIPTNISRQLDQTLEMRKICEYIQELNIRYYEEEEKILINENFEDPRIHLGFYWLESSQGISRLDAFNLRLLCQHIPVIPLIGNCQQYTTQQLSDLKILIREQWELLDFPIFVSED